MDNRNADRLIVSSRLALGAGFGGLLIVMALSGVDALRVLRQIRTEDERIRHQFLLRSHLLNDIRSDVYLSGTYVRDYLLEPEPAQAVLFRANLEQVRKEMDAALASYDEQVEPAEADQYATLNALLSQYWEVLDPILNWDADTRKARGYPFLRDEVFPRRTAMLDMASRIGDINEQQMNGGNDRVVTLLQEFQNRLAVTLFAALALGIGMAVFSAQRILSLEAHAEARYSEVAEARRQLTNLSARLVQTQETERRALSRELHDEVGQALSAALVELRNLSTGLAERSEAQSLVHVETIKSLIEGTIRGVRNMALLLRPSMLDDLGLVPALKWQAREVSKRTSMDVNVTTELTSEDLPDEYKTCVYRVVQEALHNCSRHSQAASVQIRVRQEQNRLNFSIEDDGLGFDAKESKGLGLLGIEERVTQLGGTCVIRSDRGIGTVLTVALPLPPMPLEREQVTE